LTLSIRHAAALALVGWYLMIPPGASSGLSGKEALSAPLSEWRHGASFDSADHCERILNTIRRNSAAEYKTAVKAWHAKYDNQHADRALHALAVEKTAEYSQCVASDDARLKER
jgi:hypothetical protein